MADTPFNQPQPVPWNEHATLVRFGVGTIESGAREVLAEGPLHRMLTLAGALPRDQRRELLIALPDRGRPPFRYQGEGLDALLIRPDRPAEPPPSMAAAPRRPVRRR